MEQIIIIEDGIEKLQIPSTQVVTKESILARKRTAEGLILLQKSIIDECDTKLSLFTPE